MTCRRSDDGMVGWFNPEWKNLSEAIDLILEDRREDALRGLPEDAMRDMVSLGCPLSLTRHPISL